MSTNFDPDVWVSQAQAARLRGVSRQAISKIARSGRISTMEIGGRLFVRKDQIVEFTAAKAGRPKNGKKST